MRARARRAKAAVVAVAIAAFAVVGVAVRAAHPGAGASVGTTTTKLSPPSGLIAALNEGDDGGFSGGSIAPAQGTPSASTSTS